MRPSIAIAILLGFWNSAASAAVLPNGVFGDDRFSVGYDPISGEVFWETAGMEIERLLILSESGLFSGDPSPLELCDAIFCQDTDFRIEELGFGVPIKDGSFGFVAAKGLPLEVVLADWSVSGQLYPSGNWDGREVDLIYVPEPSSSVIVPLVGFASFFWRRSFRKLVRN